MTKAYPSRTHDYVPGDQVTSSDLNAIQDGIVDTSDELDRMEDEDLPILVSFVTPSCWTGSPPPDDDGGFILPFLVQTNGTNDVWIHNARDFRDRFIQVVAWVTDDGNQIPGGTSADDVAGVIKGAAAVSGSKLMTGFFYSGAGDSAYALSWEPDGWSVDNFAIAAPPSPVVGLKLWKVTDSEAEGWVMGFIICSPKLNLA